MDKSILLPEMVALRGELQHLKKCQLHYFSLSITVTGVILGLVPRLGNELNAAFVYLSPLIVIIPCWWIFFDKAKTITRIVGYYRVLEDGINKAEQFKFVGWENSLELFRDAQIKKYLIEIDDSPKNKIWKLLTLDTPHRYWLINWYTYCSLSIFCLILFSRNMVYPDCLLFTVATILIVLTIIITSTILNNLIYKGSSYRSNQENWKRILLVIHDERIHQMSVDDTPEKAKQIVLGKQKHRQRIEFLGRIEHDPRVYDKEEREVMDEWIKEVMLRFVAGKSKK